MSEEEKIALETLKEVASDDFDTLGDDISPKMAQNMLNVIEKRQREIEYYKNKSYALYKDNLTLLEEGNETENLNYKYFKVQPIEAQEYKSESYIKDNYISKGKIKEIIKKYIDIEEVLNYASQEIYGEDLKNMILELLGEK